MKYKKILAVTMSLVMIFSYSPAVTATGEDTHGAESHFIDLGHNHSDGTWTAWGDGAGESVSLPKTSGKYYLTRDISPNGQQRLTTDENIELCLNGHNINSTVTSWGSVYQIHNGVNAHVSIENCSTSGKITRSVSSGNALMGSTSSALGSLELTNIVIDGITGTANGTCICMQGSTTLTMNSCTVTNCSSTGLGFAIYGYTSGAVTLNNCDITNNTLTGDSTTAGLSPMRITSGTPLTLNNCKITGNTGRNASVIYIQNGPNVIVKDCLITNNSTTNTGSCGAIYTTTGGVTIEGSTVIDGNTDSANRAADLTIQNATAAFHIKNTTDDTDIRLKYMNTPTVTELADIVGELKGTWVYSNDLTKKLVDNGSGALVLADIVFATGVEISPASLSMSPGESSLLTAVFSPADTDNQTVAWSSSDETVATVSASGLVTAVADGVATITVTTADGGFTDTCAVTVETAAPHTHDGNTFTAWESENTLPSASGYYYLTSDVTVANATTVGSSSSVVLCLNGHTVSAAVSGYYAYCVNGSLTVTDCESSGGFTGFTGATNGGVFNVTANASLTIDSISLTGNSASRGGVIYSGNGSVSITDCVITSNNATSEGGVIYLTGNAATACVTDTTISGNTGVNGSAITMYAGTITLDGAVITGNNATSSNGYGALHMGRNNGVMATAILKGATRITGNTKKNTTPQNVFLRQNGVEDAVQYAFVTVDEEGLEEGAEIGISLDTTSTSGVVADRYNDYDGAGRYISPEGASVPAGSEAYFSSDRVNYSVEIKNGRLHLAEVHEHAPACDASTGQVRWTAVDTLPTEAGYYYLENDIELSSAYNVSADIAICLNGHNITAAKDTVHRMINVMSGSTLTITDCSETPGVISGGVSNYGGGIQIRKGAVFNLYGGVISGNKSNAENGGEGGAVYVQGRGYVTENGETVYYAGGVFNMYGGKITGNESRLGSAVHLYGYGQEGAEAYAPGIVNIYGGEISGNSAVTAAIYVRQYGELNIAGGTFTGNTSTANGGVICGNGGSSVTITGGEFTDNTAGGNGGVIWSDAGNNLSISNAVMTGNTAVRGSAILHNNGSAAQGVLTLSNVTITDNTSTGDASGAAEAIYYNTGTLELSGLIVIRDNYYYGSPRDIRISSGCTAGVGSAGLEAGSVIGLQMSSVSGGATVVTGASEGDEAYFVLNSQANGALSYNSGNLLYTNHIHGGVAYLPWSESDTLPVTAGNYYLTKNVALTNEVDINEDVTICLNGKTVSAQANSGNGIFVVRNGAKLTLTDCSETPGVLTGGNTGSGGAVYLFPGTSLDLSNITVRNNTVENGGGAIYAKGATADEVAAGVVVDVAITNATFTGNTSSASTENSDGGVLFIGRGARAYIKNTTISGNTGKNVSAIYATSSIGGLTLEDCTITNNKCTVSSSTYSGAVYMIAGGLTLKGNNYIADNYYRYSWSSSYMIANLTIQNETGTFNIEDSSPDAYVKIKFAKTKAPGYMGTVTGELSGSYIWTPNTNYLFDAIDGGLYLLQPWSSSNALPSSGAYYLTNNVSTSSITTVSGDMTLCLHGHGVTVSASVPIYELSSDYEVIISNCVEGSFTSEGSRAADLFTATDGSLNIYGLTFSELTEAGNTSIVSAEGSADVMLKNCVFSGNTVDDRGCVYVATTGSVLLDSCEFSGNTGDECSAVLAVSSGLTMKDCLAMTNTTTASGSDYGAVVLRGLAVFEGGNTVAGNFDSETTPKDVVIFTGVGFEVRNAASNQALRLTSSSSFAGERLGVISAGEFLGSYQWIPDFDYTVTASGSDIVLSEKTYGNLEYNGKVYAPWTSYGTLPSSNPSMSGIDGYYLTDDVYVAATTAVSSSLNLCLNGKNIKLLAPAVYGVYRTTSGTINIVNNIPGSGSVSGSGVTIQTLFFTSGSSTSKALINLTGVTVRDFTNCDRYGHAIVIQGSAGFNVTDCTFENNIITSSSGGAALYLTGNGNTNITNCAFINCNATENGGAIRMSDRNVTITGSSFTDCGSMGMGGAVYATGGPTLSASGNTFTNCVSDRYGGGLAFISTESGIIYGNTFTGCIASDSYYGGAIYVNAKETPVIVKGNTITDCKAGNGGGIGVNFAGNAVIGGTDEPNIFSGCSSVTGDSGAIYVMGSSTEFNFGENIISDNNFTGVINEGMISIGSRGFMTVNGKLDATDASFEKGCALVVCRERATLTVDGARIDVPYSAEAIRSYGTTYAYDSAISGKTVIDAVYNMWMIQMESMLIARGDTVANVILTRNDGSWFSTQTGGFAEVAPLVIQDENLGANARINLTIPSGGDVDDYVFGPANITGRGTSYTVTQGVVLPGYDPAPERGVSGYDYDITSVQMTIDSQISMTYYVTADDPGTQARFYIDNSSEAVSSDSVSREVTDYGFKFTVRCLSPRTMTANIRIEILDGGGNIVTSKDDFCVVSYFDALYQVYANDSGAKSEALKQLIADLIRYGDAAQEFSEMEAPLPSEGRDWIREYVRGDVSAPESNGFALVDTTSKPYIKSASLTLVDRAELVLKVIASESDSAVLEYSDDGINWNFVPGFGGILGEMTGVHSSYSLSAITNGYELRIPDLMPHKYGRIYRLTVGEDGHAQVAYSINSYIYRMWDNDAVGTLVRCLYEYELSAAAYDGISW